GKTGWTIAAKKCFVGAAMADGREFVVAVLGSRNLWQDLKYLIEFGFRGTDPPVAATGELELASAALIPAADDEDADQVVSPRAAPKYSVRLGTFRQLKGATRLKKAVASSGYPARIEKIRSGRGHVYRVSVGSYASRNAAQQVADRLRKTHQGLSTAII